MSEIKVVTEPRVYLLSSEVLLRDYYTYLEDQGYAWQSDALSAPEELCEFAGRLCYESFNNPRPGGNAGYLARIKEQGHGEVLEFATYTFLVTDISRACSQQLTRYRAGWSFCQRSSRFVDEGEQAFVLPPALLPGYQLDQEQRAGNGPLRGTIPPLQGAFLNWQQAISTQVAEYQVLVNWLQGNFGCGLSRKEARQAARSLLPQSIVTTLAFKANARALRHALEQRCHEAADVEIRKLFNKIYVKLLDRAPHLFNDYEQQARPDGTFTLSTSSRKV